MSPQLRGGVAGSPPHASRQLHLDPQPVVLKFAALVHETAHVLLHFPTDGSARPALVTRENEAEAVTFLLCAQR